MAVKDKAVISIGARRSRSDICKITAWVARNSAGRRTDGLSGSATGGKIGRISPAGIERQGVIRPIDISISAGGSDCEGAARVAEIDGRIQGRIGRTMINLERRRRGLLRSFTLANSRTFGCAGAPAQITDKTIPIQGLGSGIGCVIAGRLVAGRG